MALYKKDGEWWFKEEYYSYGYDFPVDEILIEHRSDYQLIQVLRSKSLHGPVLILDGIIQTCYFDHYRYHRPIVALSVGLYPKPKKVLIIGGGDRGVMLEILRRYYFGELTQVEIDADVTEISRKYLPRVCGNIPSRKLHRVHELFEDGIKFVRESQDVFDVIIVDSSEPTGPGEVLFGPEFYRDALSRLNFGGILVAQAGSLLYSKQWLKTFRMLSTAVQEKIDVRVFNINVPTYGGPFAVVGACRGKNFPSESKLARIQAERLQKENSWISPNMYRAYKTLQPREASLLQKEIEKMQNQAR